MNPSIKTTPRHLVLEENHFVQTVEMNSGYKLKEVATWPDYFRLEALVRSRTPAATIDRETVEKFYAKAALWTLRREGSLQAPPPPISRRSFSPFLSLISILLRRPTAIFTSITRNFWIE